MTPDEIVCVNGDRLTGWLVSNDGVTIVFRSERFGELRFRVGEAQVIARSASDPRGAKTAMPASVAPPATLGKPPDAWRGRLAFSTESVHDTARRYDELFEANLGRKWPGDDLQFEARYEFSRTNDTANTEVFRTSMKWRHELTRQLFLLYHPLFEDNANFYYQGIPADYRLLQQEFGAGVTIWSRDRGALRTGLSDNACDVWSIDGHQHFFRQVQSAFVELDAALPGRLQIAERGFRYFSVQYGQGGWENRVELSKHLTETVLVSVRHEIRRHNPDLRVQDYSRLRMLLGLEF